MACGDKSDVLQSTGVTSAPGAGGAAPDRSPFTQTQRSVSVLTAAGCGLCKGISVDVVPHGAAVTFCFLLSKKRHIFCGEFGVLPA